MQKLILAGAVAVIAAFTNIQAQARSPLFDNKPEYTSKQRAPEKLIKKVIIDPRPRTKKQWLRAKRYRPACRNRHTHYHYRHKRPRLRIISARF